MANWTEAKRARDAAERSLMRLPNVTGVFTGQKVVKGENTGEPCVTVMVTKKVPIRFLKHEHRVPRTLKGQPHAVKTDVVEVGRVRYMGAEHRSEHRPLKPGCSAAHEHVTAGTLGGIVFNAQGEAFALSNQHVFAPRGAMAQDRLLQPSPYDGGASGNEIAELTAFSTSHEDCDNELDAAIARILPHVAYELEYLTAGTYAHEITSVEVGDLMHGDSRTSGYRELGPVIGTDVSVNVWADEQVVFRYVNMVATKNNGDVAPGDSGSVLLKGDRPAALLFAASEEVAIHMPIGRVLRHFGVRFGKPETSQSSKRGCVCGFVAAIGQLLTGWKRG